MLKYHNFIIVLWMSSTFSYRLQCPYSSQRSLRAAGYCRSNLTSEYTCLYDTNRFWFSERCNQNPDYVTIGERYVITGSLRNVDCSSERYQPFPLWSNVSGMCLYQKSMCEGEGQLIFNNGSLISDRTCRCDYTKGYKFLQRPKQNCFCIPSEEDCSCNRNECTVDKILSPDYECIEDTQDENSECPRIENKSNSWQYPKIERFTDQQRTKQLSSRAIFTVGVIALILLYAGIVFIVHLTKLLQRKHQKVIRLEKYIPFRDEWNELKKATYKNNLSNVKKELQKDVHDRDLMISMKIACIAGYTSIVKVLLLQFILKNISTLDDEGNTPLLCASLAGNLSIVKLFLKNINDCSNNGQTPLMNACINGSSRIADVLLHYGADVNVKNEKGETPLLLACQSNRVDVIKRLIQAKADMTACNNDGVNALMYACGDGTLNVVRMILNRSECNVNDVDKSKRSPLFHACSSLSSSYQYETLNIKNKIKALLSVLSERHYVVTRFLINNKADINIVDDRGVTPLMLACRDKCEISVGLLLNDNAKINATDKINSSNALMWAMQRHPDIHMINIIKMLVHKGIDVNIIDANKNTSLIRACHKMNEMKSDSAIRNESRYYCVQIVDLFLRERVDVNAKNDSNETSLEVACKGNHVDIIKKLVQAGADLIRNLFPAFDAACKYGSFESIKTLSELDISDTLKSCNLLFLACGELHLESVCSYNCAKLIRFIIEKYGGVEEADNRGVTPLMLACQNNCSKAVEVLVQHNQFINAVDKIGGSTALAWTLRWESNNDITTVIQTLIKGNADADKSDNQGFTPLMMACERGNKEIVQILNNKVQYEEEDNRPLQVTCQKSIEFLMENKQSTSEFTVPSQSVSKLTVDEMITAIADLVKYKRKEIEENEEKVWNTFKSKVENICFEHDAKASNNVEFGTNSDNEIGPLFKAFEVKNKIILGLLIEANVEINKRNSRNVTPLMKACELEESYINILKMLVSKTVDINKRDKEGNTALLIVCKKTNPCLEMIKCLFDRQPQDIPDCTIGNNFGTTPLMSLCTRKSDENVDNIIEIIDFLINYLPTGGINQKVCKDKTYLMLACKYGHYKIVAKLLKRGALINNECLTIATKRGNIEIYTLVDTLIKNMTAT